MAQKTIKAHMKQRRDTKANWASVNPVLLDGELGIVSDDPNLYKVGDGATAWNDLPFRGFDGTLAQELGTSPNAVISQKVVSEKLTELESEALINAMHFEGNGWSETKDYIMLPEYEYELTNKGNNPIIAIGITPASANLQGFPTSLEGGESVIVRPSERITALRFYFNGQSSLLARTHIKVDEKLLFIEDDYNGKINDLSDDVTAKFKVVDTPFSNASLMNEENNYLPLAIKSVQVHLNNSYVIPQFGIEYLWHNAEGNRFIRISEYADGNVVRWDDWSRDNYTPTNESNDVITILKDDITIKLVVDWTLVTIGQTWYKFLAFKQSCYVQDSNKNKVIEDKEGTMAEFINAILDAKYFAETYQELANYKFVLAYLWKNVGDAKTTLIRIRMTSPNMDDNYANVTLNNVADTIEEYTFGEGKFYFKVDWSKVPNGLAWAGVGEIQNILIGEQGDNYVYEGYSAKDCTKNQVWVSQDGTKDFTTIGEAYASITDSSYDNQYEVVVCPGTYDEYNLIPPPFTHTYGLYPNSVKVTSRNWANIGDTLPVFDQMKHPSKLSNLTIESWTGYCIHYDNQMNNVSIKNENLHLIKQYYEGANMAIIGGGSFKYGVRYEWKSCIFEGIGAQGNAACHTQAGTTGDNTSIVFDACSFINCYPNIGSVGAFGKCTCEIRNCNFGFGLAGLTSWFSPIRSNDNASEYLANRVEWGVIGGGNKNFAPQVRNVISTIQILANSPIEVRGNAVAAIFGNNYVKSDKSSARVKCSLTSMYFIEDSQAGLSGCTELNDVYQLWKRLGDCSSVNKTLTIEVGGVSKTYTFNKNYLSLKTSETDIIADMQSVFTNCEIKKVDDNSVGYEFINTTDKMYISVTDADILAGEFITKQGTKATRTTPTNAIVGMVVKDTIKGENAPVWTSAVSLIDSVYNGNGDIGLNEDGELYWTGADKPIGFIQNKIFYPYY